MAGGDWGWQGVGNRALEFPEGGSAGLSPAGRARLRYNPGTGQLELSTDGAVYTALATGGITGGGTTNRVTRWSSPSSLTDSFADLANDGSLTVRDDEVFSEADFQLAVRRTPTTGDGGTVLSVVVGEGGTAEQGIAGFAR